MIARILCAYDGSESAKAALIRACRLASQTDAGLDGIYVKDSRRLQHISIKERIVSGLGVAPITPQLKEPEELLQELEDCEAESRNCSDEFKRICREEGIEASFLSEAGVSEQSLAEHARGVDFIVTGISGPRAEFFGDKTNHTVNSLLKKITAGLLVVPDNTWLDKNCALIAYDGSPASERALKTAADMGRVCKFVDMHLLTISADRDQAATIQEPACSYLEEHGFLPHIHRLDGKVSEKIIECAQELKPNFIAMGAYGSSPIKTTFFGSTTDAVLNSAPCAVMCIR